MEEWILTTSKAALMVCISTAGIYLGMVLLTRVAGLRSFSKMSSFDFAVTVAIGSVLASTVVAKDPPLLQGLVALAALYAIQIGVAALRTRSKHVRTATDNQPLLLMAGTRILHEHLKKAQITEADLRAKLREANVTRLDQVLAVVQETTGDVSVLHGDPDAELDLTLLEGVGGCEELRT